MITLKHINYTDATRAEKTSPAWLPVGAQIGELVNKWAGRSDLAVFIGEGATNGLAPALFKPTIAEIEVNVGIAFGEDIGAKTIGDLRDSDTQYEWPAATGMILHEAMHARLSKFDLPQVHKDLAKDEAAAFILLEESRIEAQGVALDSRHRPFLRACAMQVVLGDMDGIEDQVSGKIGAAAQLMGLVGGRVIGDVLDIDDVANVLDIVQRELGADNYKRMADILAEFQAHTDHHNVEPLYPLAREWAKIVREAKEEAGEPQDSEGGEGEGEGSESGGGFGDFMREVMDALSDAVEDVAISNARDLDDQQESEEWKKIANSKQTAAREQKQHRDTSSRIFSKDTTDMATCSTMSRLESRRSPKPAERAAAVTVARMLEKAKYRERDVVTVHTAVPGGRLRPRALVQGAAQKAAGRVPDVEPWRKKVRKHTDEPKLSIGVMVDISGSMGDAMEPMATTAWVMSEAARRIQARAAMVYYGSDVFPTLKAGQHLDAVYVYSAPDWTEKFDMAFQAVDGALNLLHGEGARLLVVVSDGCYTGSESAAAKKWVKRCQEAGVGVLWLTYDGYGHNAVDICKGSDAVVISDRMDPAGAAAKIGAAAAQAMTKVGQRNAA